MLLLCIGTAIFLLFINTQNSLGIPRDNTFTTMKLFITATTVLLFATIYSLKPTRLKVKRSTITNFTFIRSKPCVDNETLIIQALLRRKLRLSSILSKEPSYNTTSVLYLALLTITNANDVQVNPGPERDYNCGTCDKIVDWEDRGIICETCDQWYHASCQDVHTLSYNQLGDSDLNISWHCVICNNPNYSTILHDYNNIETSSISSTNISDIPPYSPDQKPTCTIKPVHTSTPTRNKSPHKCNQPLKILNINFQSIKSKLCRLSNLIDSTRPDIIIGSETWLDNDIKNPEICPSGYVIHRKDRNNKIGGGVLLAIKSELNSELVPELDTNCEIVWAKINLKGTGNIYIGAYYRRNISDEESLKQLEASLSRACGIENATVIVGGDMNLPGWDWKTNTLKPNSQYVGLHNFFMDIINNNALTQIVQEPTRLENTLDLILTNRPGKAITTETIPGISDHDIVYTELDFRPVRYHQKPRQIPLYNKANWEGMKTDILGIFDQIQQMYNDPNCTTNAMWTLFKQTIVKAINEHIPQKQVKEKDKKPWINSEIKKNLKRLHRLYKKKKKTGDHETKEKYRKLKHHTQKIQRQAYWRYIENIVTPNEDEPRSGMKKFWTYIKHKRKDNVGITSLKTDGKLYTDPKSKSNILNKQFQSAFSEKTTFTEEEFDGSNRMDPRAKVQSKMKPFNITVNGILKLLKQLNPYKAPGPDNLSPRILKELATEVAPLLQLIFQKSLLTGNIPDDWRTANVSPVYKKGPKTKAENYRPISLTSICCKIMEHIIASNIMNHGENKNILYPLQHGFRRKRSCETQLLEFVDDVSKNLQDGKQTDILIMDFAKAFDKVNHSLLIHKLTHYGIESRTTNWIKNWLNDRKQSVVIDGTSSDEVNVDSGVPQDLYWDPVYLSTT